MELTLSILRCPDSVVPEQRRVPGGDYVIGRGSDASWVLPDPDRLLSKHHCVLEFRGGGWQVRDLSTNGTFVNHAAAPVGRDQVKMLEDGDRLRLGAYEIEVRTAQAAAQASPGWSGGLPGAAPQPPGGGWDQPAAAPASSGGWDQPAATPPTPGGWDQPAAPAWGAPAEQPWGGPPPRDEPLQPRLPGDPYLGAKAPGAGLPGLPSAAGPQGDADPFAEGPAMPDHRPSTSDAFLPPRPMQQVPVIPDSWDLGPTPAAPAPPPPPQTSAPSGAAGQIPDDWNFDLSPGAPGAAPPPAPAKPVAPPAPPPAPPRAPAGPDPFTAPLPPAGPDPFAAPLPPSPAMPGPGSALPSGPDPFVPTMPPAPPAPAPIPRSPPQAAPPMPPPAGPDPFAEPPPPPVAAPPPAVVPPAPPRPAAGTVGADGGLAAFLAGAGLPPHLAATADPDAALHALGAAFHAAIAGLRQLLIARGDVKREFRIEQTMLRAAGNNPVKFAASDEQALASLLTAGAQVGPRAVRETVEDLTAHQVATLAATQAAARALLARLAPAGLEAQEGGSGGLFASKDKRLWEAYKRLHQQVTEQFDDDFDSAFGKEFARAYEQASRKDR
ncbi:type VI secretion system-associated FHA domain protein TagH [Roseomonas sp. HF4]|uniref:type VI secretion system-associated FHA domain protein TagH n=1 Tax=Roseomonas sp. HF4 TaxID=2562313 RepID=UPI0014851A08|nr:type VI secretion system-associated FHA domain protein TagH [Roseomonas sp. HF4]